MMVKREEGEGCQDQPGSATDAACAVRYYGRLARERVDGSGHKGLSRGTVSGDKDEVLMRPHHPPPRTAHSLQCKRYQYVSAKCEC